MYRLNKPCELKTRVVPSEQCRKCLGFSPQVAYEYDFMRGSPARVKLKIHVCLPGNHTVGPLSAVALIWIFYIPDSWRCLQSSLGHISRKRKIITINLLLSSTPNSPRNKRMFKGGNSGDERKLAKLVQMVVPNNRKYDKAQEELLKGVSEPVEPKGSIQHSRRTERPPQNLYRMRRYRMRLEGEIVCGKFLGVSSRMSQLNIILEGPWVIVEERFPTRSWVEHLQNHHRTHEPSRN
ncbi:hypothetical protein RF11_16362 [Thelohanellus kitauei]|uniref:Uncharacterized protein n=1 Tax=Thelohanellus kitauei TaxID=669202 RepID=A0A0C2M990_THEKT|nr:hypothetical protein RF11_16362 [Thelohanellus kitauei]